MAHDDRPEEIGAVFEQLFEDAKGYGRAEVAYYRLLLSQRVRAARVGIAAGGIALALASGVAVALMVGLVMTLAAIIGPGWATLIVVVFGSLGSALLGRFAWLRIAAALKPPEKDL
ncbi:MAG: phage holin family protein [Pseudomonadota bacterium]